MYSLIKSIVRTSIIRNQLKNPATFYKTILPLHIEKKCNSINRNYSIRHPKTPDLIYVPRISRWIINKVRLKYLKKMWDPEFSEGAFIYGTTRAVCRITEIIHDGKPELLDKLVTQPVQLKLIEDMNTRLTKTQKSVIKLKPTDIKMLIPVNISLKHEVGKKNCRINMRVLALKWFRQVNGVLGLVLVAVQTEFLRDYSSSAPDWIISGFEVLECTMLSESVQPQH